jgi:hypothetical protein
MNKSTSLILESTSAMPGPLGQGNKEPLGPLIQKTVPCESLDMYLDATLYASNAYIARHIEIEAKIIVTRTALLLNLTVSPYRT